LDSRQNYSATFLEDSLGLCRGSVEPQAVPTDFVDRLAGAMRGAEAASSQEPKLEEAVLDAGKDIVQSILETDGIVVWKERWPRGAKYAVCLTHDVDSLQRPL
jgi:hypothetical protein